jgi:hypothetical protein
MTAAELAKTEATQMTVASRLGVAAMLVTLSTRRGHAGHPAEDTRMTATRRLGRRPCRSLGPC